MADRANQPTRVKCPHCNGEGHKTVHYGDSCSITMFYTDSCSSTMFCAVCMGMGWTIARTIRDTMAENARYDDGQDELR